MTEPNYKTLLTPKFAEDLRSVYNSVWEKRAEIRENMDEDFCLCDWGVDFEWNEIEYFINQLGNLAEYLENK